MIPKRPSPLAMRIQEMELEMGLIVPPKKPVTLSLLLKCPDVGAAPLFIKKTLGEALVDFLLNLTDVDDSIDDEWYYSLLRCNAYNEEGDVCVTFDSEQEEHMFYRDPTVYLLDAGKKMNNLMESIAILNEEEINDLYSQVTIKDLKVSQVLNNHLMLIIHGTQYEPVPPYSDSWQ
jgi:hypothetical protein